MHRGRGREREIERVGWSQEVESLLPPTHPVVLHLFILFLFFFLFFFLYLLSLVGRKGGAVGGRLETISLELQIRANTICYLSHMRFMQTSTLG